MRKRDASFCDAPRKRNASTSVARARQQFPRTVAPAHRRTRALHLGVEKNRPGARAGPIPPWRITGLMMRLAGLGPDGGELVGGERVGEPGTGAVGLHVVGDRDVRLRRIVRVVAFGEHPAESLGVAGTRGIPLAA